MNREMVETYRFLRDRARPVSQQDAADLEKVRAPMPPSKAHLARIKRHANGVRFMEQERATREYSVDEQQRLKRLDFYNRTIADMGGSRTIQASETFQSRGPTMVDVQAARSRELEPKPVRDELALLAHKARQARAKQLRDLVHMYKTQYEPDMFDVLDTFGSFDSFREGTKK